MKRLLHATLAAGVVGLAACDAAPPPDASVSQPTESQAGNTPAPLDAAESEAVTAARTALVDVIRDKDTFARARRLGTLLPTLGPEAVPIVHEMFLDPKLDLGAMELELLLRYWASHEPEGASRWAVEEAPSDYRTHAVLASIAVWAEKDPQAARKAAEQWAKEPRDLVDELQIALVRGWFARNPSELRQFIRDIGMGFPRQRALSTYIRIVIQNDGIDAVVNWAESLPDDDATYKLEVYRQVAAALPLFDHAATMRFFDAHGDGPYGKDLRDIIARRWVLTDGPAAMEWLAKAPDDRESKLAVRLTFSLWAQRNRDAALAWMATQTATGELEPWLEPALPVYARTIAMTSPADAIEWAERIKYDEERELLLTRIARRWRVEDEAAAEAWVEQSSLSEEARARARIPAVSPKLPSLGPGSD